VLPVLGTLIKIPGASYPVFIVLSLVLIVNSRIRIAYLKDRLVVLSIIAEGCLAAYMSMSCQGFVYLVFFSTMADACMLLKDESYTLSGFLGIGIIYSVYNMYSLEWVVIIFAFYLMSLLLILQLRKELGIRTDTEALYDQIRKYTYELEAARSRLLDYSKQVEKNAQLEERNRISRELHDSIGHSLTGILMQVDACIQVMEVNKDKGIEILKSVYENIGKSIDVVRQTVRKMRPVEYKTSIDAINGLIGKFKKDTGINVNFNISGAPYEVLPSIETVLYRNIQEALTNAVRHGKPQNIGIDIAYGMENIELTISNDGKSPGVIKKGFGLSGMEERVALTGGTVEFSGDNGFKIHMVIPKGEI
jgi:signal transduction histidine kinase